MLELNVGHAAEYWCNYGMKTGSGELFTVLMVHHSISSILAPFEEATKMVICDDLWICDIIPDLFLLEHVLYGLTDQILEEHQVF